MAEQVRPPGGAGAVADGPPAALYRAVAAVAEEWLVGLVTRAARRGLGACPAELEERARRMAATTAPRLLDELALLLATDVDAQRSNPLALLRAAVEAPTALLRDARVPAPSREEFARRNFPDDLYDLGPATWRDVDESLHEPGLVWGAWKAATVLRRRREQGLR